MHDQIRQPVIPSRTFSSRGTSQLFDRNPSGAFDEYSSFQPKKQSFIPKNTPPLTHQTSFKSSATLYRIDPNIVPQLLEKYTQANLFYRDEEFSQQADLFLTKMATDRKVPDEFRSKYPFYQILGSLSKIFMLNEFELTIFGCMLDHCSWNLDEVLSLEESSCLREFPSNFGLEISMECKRLIVYLLINTFSLKQYLGEKTDVDQIQSYCEQICDGFQNLYNRWLRTVPQHRFNISLQEINRKFKYLSKRDINGMPSSVKDYNIMVDEIMILTGSYTSRTKENAKAAVGHPQPFEEIKMAKNPVIFHDFNLMPTVSEQPKPVQPMQSSMGFSTPFIEEKSVSKPGYDMGNDMGAFKMPSFFASLSKQPSYSALLNNVSVGRGPSYDNTDDYIKKKTKEDSYLPTLQNNTSIGLIRGASSQYGRGFDMQSTSFGHYKQEEQPLLNLPNLVKNISNMSQDDEVPSLSRFQSNLSFLYDNK